MSNPIVSSCEQFLSGNKLGMRIYEEFVTISEKLEKAQIQNTIVIFGSARIERNGQNQKTNAYYEAAYSLSKKLALWAKANSSVHSPEKKYYICTGGGGGIMEAANKGASDAGEPTIGFNILLPHEQKANAFISKDLLFNFDFFFIRKFYFAYLAKAFVIFPGGFGTLDELFEIITLAQTQKMQKTVPIVVIGKEFYENIMSIPTLVENNLVSQSDKALFLITDNLEEAFDFITANIDSNRLFIDCDSQAKEKVA